MSVLMLLGWKTAIFTTAALLCGTLLFLLRSRSPRIERLGWCCVLLLGVFGGGFAISVPYTVPLPPHEPANEPEPVVPAMTLRAEPDSIPVTFDVRPQSAPEPTVHGLNDVITPHEPPHEPLHEPGPAVPTLNAFMIYIAGIAVILCVHALRFAVLLYKLKTAQAATGEYGQEWTLLGGPANRLLLTDGLGPGLVATPWGANVVVPRELWEETTPEIRAGILRHELAHWKNWDLFWAGTSRILAVVHWFNPVAWFVLHRIDEAAERLADTAAFDGVERFAESLLAFHDSSQTILLSRSAFAGGSVNRRIRHLRTFLEQPGDSVMKKTTLGILLTLIFTVGLVHLKFVPVVAVIAEEKPQTQTEKETKDIPSGVTLKFVDPAGKPVPKGELKIGGIANTRQELNFQNGEIRVETEEGKPFTNFGFYVYADGFTPYNAQWDNPKNDPIPETITTVLDPARTIGGTVVDVAGNPVEDVQVDVHFLWGKRQRIFRDAFLCSLKSKTDAEGRWTCTMIPPERLGERPFITLIHPDYADTSVDLGSLQDYQADASGKFPLRQTIVRGVTFRGKVVDESGTPIAGAKLLSNLCESSYPSKKNFQTTDDNGEFAFENCRNEISGPFIIVGAEGYAPEAYRDLSLLPDTPPTVFTLNRGRTVAMEVIDRNGKPVENARVRLTWLRDFREYFSEVTPEIPKTDADGKSVWNHAPKDEFTVETTGDGFMRDAEEKILKDSNEYTFVIRRPIQIDCTVVDAKTNEPVPNFRITGGMGSGEKDPKIFWHGFGTKAGADGKMEWSQDYAWEDRTFVLMCEAEGYTPFVSPTIPQDVDRYVVKFTMRRPSKDDPTFLYGTVLTPDGKPAKEALVGIATKSRRLDVEQGYSLSGDPWDTATTDALGEFRLSKKESGLNEQDYKLLILHDSGFARIVKEEFEKSNEPVRLTPWARIEGTVRIGKTAAKQEQVGITYNPIEDDWTQGNPWIQYSYRNNTTDENGRYVFDRVFPGEGRVGGVFATTDTGGRPHTWRYSDLKWYNVKPGETQTIDLGGVGRPVIGKLELPEDLETTADFRLAFVETSLTRLPYPQDAQADMQFFSEALKPLDDQRSKRYIRAEKYEETLRDWEQSAEGKAVIAQKPEEYKKAKAGFETMMRYKKAEAASGDSSRYSHVDKDGNFRLDDVPTGRWFLIAKLEKMKPAPDWSETWLSVTTEFEIPAIPGGRSDEPLDVGTLKLLDRLIER